MYELNKIPIVLFTYRRPEILLRVLNCLQLEKIDLLYVFSDGASSPELMDEVWQVRDIIHRIDWCECHISENKENLGLGVSIKNGVTSVLQRHDAAVIFEDDLVCLPGTIEYLCSALRYYALDRRVMSVTGWTHPMITPNGIGDLPYFDGKAECWAWGTWARAWDGMNVPALDIMSRCLDLGIDIEKYGTDLPKMAAEASSKNLWAVGWFYHHMLYQGLCLRPPYSMVEQICWEAERSTTTTEDMVNWKNPQLKNTPIIPSYWPIPNEHLSCAELWRKAIDSSV